MNRFRLALCLLLFFASSSLAQSPPRPNIVLIIGDDMRYDTYGPTGAPDWFVAPSISRVADEGVNFTNYFCVYSLCIPSRSSIMTGLYPHSNGAIDNSSHYYSALPTIGSILSSAGYNTAMVGKYHAYYWPQPGWDYWFSKMGETDYTDPTFNINGVFKTISGYTTNIIGDTAESVLSTIDTPFLVNIGHIVAHKKVYPEAQYDGQYSQEEMPLPSNFYQYSKNFPSFLYERGHYVNIQEVDEDYQEYFEGLLSLNDNLEDIFEILESRNILDNTMIIFTSDNGSLYGEHKLAGKGLAYESSIRQPLFIRYPAWFEPGTEVTSSLGLHVDLATTICEAAGIDPESFGFHGVSLHEQATGETQRKVMLYENIKAGEGDDGEDVPSPSIRSVRDFNYKYIKYQCDSKTEEFFDLVNDPLENTNLINHASYSSLISQYRQRLDSLRTVLNDTLSIDTLKKDCYLKNPTRIRDVPIQHSDSGIIFHFPFRLSPNPAQDENEFSLLVEESGESEIQFVNMLGQVMYSRRLNLEAGENSLDMEGVKLASGIYYVRLRNGERCGTQLLVKSARFE